MPGMDGYQVTAKLKGNLATKNIPVIMVTATDDRSARMLGLSAGAEDFLSKPVDRAELWLRVRNLLRLKAYGDYHDKYSQMLEGEVGSRAAALVESERLYRSTFDAAPVGIAHMSLEGKWLRVNQRLGDLLGYSADDLTHREIQDLVQSDRESIGTEPPEQLAAGSLARHSAAEQKYLHRDGHFVWVRVNTSLHRDSRGQPQHFISVVEDITERRALEAKIRQTGKMDAIGRLASGVAHDFNNLLTVILGFPELMAGDTAVVEEHGLDLAEIIKAARRASGLTKQLLAFSRHRVLRPAPLDVNRLSRT